MGLSGQDCFVRGTVSIQRNTGVVWMPDQHTCNHITLGPKPTCRHRDCSTSLSFWRTLLMHTLDRLWDFRVWGAYHTTTDHYNSVKLRIPFYKNWFMVLCPSVRFEIGVYKMIGVHCFILTGSFHFIVQLMTNTIPYLSLYSVIVHKYIWLHFSKVPETWQIQYLVPKSV